MKILLQLSKWALPGLLGSLLFLMPYQSKGQTINYKAYAIFLYSFTKHIDWPVYSGEEFKITVVGKSKVSAELLPLMQNKSAWGKKITVSQVNTAEEMGDSQLVYLSDGKSSELGKVLEKILGKSTLVVTEREGLVKKGAGISFMIYEDSSLHFEISDKIAQSSNLKVSTELKNMAHK
jgi:hypothetical protein